MPVVKTPALARAEQLANVGNRLAALPNLVTTVAAALVDGVPANEQTGAAAIAPEELVALIGEDVAAKIRAAAAALA